MNGEVRKSKSLYLSIYANITYAGLDAEGNVYLAMKKKTMAKETVKALQEILGREIDLLVYV